MNEVIINKEPVELYKILKFQGWLSSGGVVLGTASYVRYALKWFRLGEYD